VWRGVEAGESAVAIERRLMERFNVSAATAHEESTRFLEALLEAGLLVDSSAG
jgi:hypothetical protein